MKDLPKSILTEKNLALLCDMHPQFGREEFITMEWESPVALEELIAMAKDEMKWAAAAYADRLASETR